MYSQSQKQKGSVFLISLMLLMVVTLLTFSVAESVVTQQKMSTNSKESDLALQVAEQALRDAESAILGLTTAEFTTAFTLTGGSTGKVGFYDGQCAPAITNCYLNTKQDLFNNASWTNVIADANGMSCGTSVSTCKIFGQYMIIRLGQIAVTKTGGAVNAISTAGSNTSATPNTSTVSWKYKIIARGTGNNALNPRVLVGYSIVSQPST